LTHRSRLFVSPLATSLAVCALSLTALALAFSNDTIAQALRTPAASLVVGVVFTALAWYPLRLAPRTATGARRAVARAAAILTLFVALLHGVGSELRDLLDAREHPLFATPWREFLAAVSVATATVYTWTTSPAVRG
jgi:hypothetical protein